MLDWNLRHDEDFGALTVEKTQRFFWVFFLFNIVIIEYAAYHGR